MDKSKVIVVGPVIGKVTDSTARILVEFNFTGEISCTLSSQSGEQFKVSSKFRMNKPTVFVFKGLKAKTRYSVSFDPYIEHIPSSFKTLTKGLSASNFKIAVVSCNDLSVMSSKPEESNLWNDLFEKIQENQIDYILHIGDSVYMDMGKTADDKPYNKCQTALMITPKAKWDTKAPELRDIIQSEYRKTWGHPSVAKVLANVPNLTMCDDHEVREDWGFKKKDFDPTSADHFYGWLARESYYQYQRQLRENINFNNMSSITEEYYYEILNGVGIVFLDYRGVRSWHREHSDLGESHLGKKQWKFLEDLFKKTGKFAELNYVIFVSPLPLVWINHAPVKGSTLRRTFNNTKQEETTFLSQKEQGDLLTLLREWKGQKEGRELTIVGGDIHMGGHTDIYYGKQKALQQLTSSCINGTQLAKLQTQMEKFLLNTPQDLGNGYTFSHSDWTHQNNYGIMKAAVKGGKIDVKCQLVACENEGTPTSLKEVEYTSSS